MIKLLPVCIGLLFHAAMIQAGPQAFTDRAEVLLVKPITEQAFETEARRKCAAPGPAALLSPAASLGADIRRQEQLAHRPAECHWEETLVPSTQVIGYRVTYRYDGNVYTVDMQEPPGDFLPVRVSFQPQSY